MSVGAVSTRDILIQTEDMEAATAVYETVLGLGMFMREPAMIGLLCPRSLRPDLQHRTKAIVSV